MNLSFKIAIGVFLGLTLFFLANYILQMIFDIAEAKGFLGLTIGYIICLMLCLIVNLLLFGLVGDPPVGDPNPVSLENLLADVLIFSLFASPITALILEILVFKLYTDFFNNTLCSLNIINFKNC